MDVKDEFKYLVGGYYGVREMDEYDLKVYVLKEIELYIRDYLENNKIDGLNYREEAQRIEQDMPLKTKLQDSLLVLNKFNAPTQLVMMIKKRLKKMNEQGVEE